MKKPWRLWNLFKGNWCYVVSNLTVYPQYLLISMMRCFYVFDLFFTRLAFLSSEILTNTSVSMEGQNRCLFCYDVED